MSEIETHTIDPSATSPGAILKRCREYHEISLEEAEEATKIGANYLQALEDDQISQFASPAYLKGFLRIYATYLSLNPDDMIRLFDKLYTPGGTQIDKKKNTSSNPEPTPRKKFPIQKLLMPGILLALILITSTIINRSPATSPRQNPPAPTTAVTATPAIHSTHSSARQSPAAIKTKEAIADQQQNKALPTATNKIQPPALESSKGFIVRMKVTQSGTLTVTIDGSTSHRYDLIVGDNIEWKADRSITLELSNAGGVEIYLNGKQLKSFGQSGKPAVINLDADGVRQ